MKVNPENVYNICVSAVYILFIYKESPRLARGSVNFDPDGSYRNGYLYVSRSHLIGKYMRHLPFVYEEYDGCVFLADDAEKNQTCELPQAVKACGFCQIVHQTKPVEILATILWS